MVLVLVLITRGLLFDGIQDPSLSEIVPKDGEIGLCATPEALTKKVFLCSIIVNQV
jgi:hypothetical protein